MAIWHSTWHLENVKTKLTTQVANVVMRNDVPNFRKIYAYRALRKLRGTGWKVIKIELITYLGESVAPE